jgi:hypothetical protein
MNSPPSVSATATPRPITTPEPASTGTRRARHTSRPRRYAPRSLPTKPGSWSCPVFFRKSDASTGMRVSVSSSEPARANTTVHAMGLNIFPSMPPRLRIGRYTMMMMPMPKAMGLTTSWAASAVS